MKHLHPAVSATAPASEVEAVASVAVEAEAPQAAAREASRRHHARAREAVPARRRGRPLTGEAPSVNVNVRLTPTLTAALDSHAAGLGMGRSEALRAVLAAHLTAPIPAPGEPPPEVARLWQAVLAGASGNETAARHKIGALTRLVRDL